MHSLPPPKRNRATYLLLGAMVGGLGVALPCLFFLFATQYHYYHEGTFFQGKIGDVEIQGIEFMDYHGFGFLEGNQWKVQIVRSNESPVIVYQNRPRHQESLPHQPEIKIEGNQVQIDDGMTRLTIGVDH